MGNYRLRGAIVNAELTPAALAGAVGVDVKTVGRWLNEDRIPYPVTRMKIARLLHQQETFLWPSLLERPEACALSMAELDGVWPTRTAISSDTWHAWFDRSTRSLDILVYAGIFLIEMLDFSDVLAWKAAQGTTIRLLIGNPDSMAVQVREGELPLSCLADRCRAMRRYLGRVASQSGIEVRTHSSTLYASHFRFDDILLINAPAFGAWNSESPVYQLREAPGGSLFTFYRRAFERTWGRAEPEDDAAKAAQDDRESSRRYVESTERTRLARPTNT